MQTEVDYLSLAISTPLFYEPFNPVVVVALAPIISPIAFGQVGTCYPPLTYIYIY